MDALLVAALVLPRLTVEGRAGLGLIAAIAAVVLRVAAPIERNAFVRIHALEVRRRAVGPAAASVLGQHEIVRTGALVVGRLR